MKTNRVNKQTLKRHKNRLRRLFLFLSYLKTSNYGKAIIALLLARGSISETSAASLTGLSVLNSRAIISALLSSGLLHIVGERQLQMKNRRRYVEIIFGIDPVSANRVLRDILFNTLSLMNSILDSLRSDQFLYLCEKDKVLFFEHEVEQIEYRCPICGESLTPVLADIDKIIEFINTVKEEFRRIVI